MIDEIRRLFYLLGLEVDLLYVKFASNFSRGPTWLAENWTPVFVQCNLHGYLILHAWDHDGLRLIRGGDYTDKKTCFLHIFESFCPCTDPLWLK